MMSLEFLLKIKKKIFFGQWERNRSHLSSS